MGSFHCFVLPEISREMLGYVELGPTILTREDSTFFQKGSRLAARLIESLAREGTQSGEEAKSCLYQVDLKKP